MTKKKTNTTKKHAADIQVIDSPADQSPRQELIPNNQPVHPGQLISLAMGQEDVDLDKLERLFELQKSYEDNEARKSFHVAMSKFRAICPSIYNDGEVKFEARNGGADTNYKFATLAGALATIKESLASCGLSHNWETNQIEAQIKVTCFITHEKGYQIETSLQNTRDDSGNKNNIQAMKSTISYLERITLFALLGLASGDDDNDGAGSPSSYGESSPSSNSVETSGRYAKCPEQKFTANFASWSSVVKKGERTADGINDNLKEKYKTELTENQLSQLKTFESSQEK